MINNYINKTRDFFIVLRGTWFMLLFDLLAFFAFLFVAQGRDVLLVVTEYTGNFSNKWQLAGLLAAVFFWSISSEYVTRTLNYFSDNSGKALDPERVDHRKKYQRMINLLSLFYPTVLMITAFTSVYMTNYHALSSTSEIYNLRRIETGTAVIIFLFVLEIALLWWMYPGKLIVKVSQKYKWLSWLKLSTQEKQWVNKLYGILNEVRVDLPASHNPYSGKDLPRDQLFSNGMYIPDSKYVVPEDRNPLLIKGDIKVWMFRIRIPFYHNLVRQLFILTIISVLIIVNIGLIFPVSWNIALGATSIICFSFACWQLIYLLLCFLDKAQSFPVRFSLLVWLIICSVINNDHPVRLLDGANVKRQTVAAHFQDWTARTAADTTTGPYYRIGKADSIPVIFVSAEGGALRTGAFTALLLARLQDRFPQFQRYLYSYSSVSGGTLGSNFFNAQIIRNKLNGGKDKGEWFNASKEFFKTDFLSALTAKLVFGEIINYFIPFHITAADRAIALERSFELGWHRAYKKDSLNQLSSPFNQTVNSSLPAIFINTTEVETGTQNVWSNVQLNGFPLAQSRDIYQRLGASLRYSSAINLSNRFPLISPAGCFFITTKNQHGKDSVYRRHFVDGGYYENKGSETLLQVLKILHLENQKIKPYILQFNFSGDTTIRGVNAFNEITEITSAIYNTRNGRGNIAQDLLKKYVDSLHGVFIPLNLKLNSKELPMNWILSNTAADRLDSAIKQLVGRANKSQVSKIFKTGAKDELQKLFFYDPLNNLRQPTKKPE